MAFNLADLKPSFKFVKIILNSDPDLKFPFSSVSSANAASALSSPSSWSLVKQLNKLRLMLDPHRRQLASFSTNVSESSDFWPHKYTENHAELKPGVWCVPRYVLANPYTVILESLLMVEGVWGLFFPAVWIPICGKEILKLGYQQKYKCDMI